MNIQEHLLELLKNETITDIFVRENSPTWIKDDRGMHRFESLDFPVCPQGELAQFVDEVVYISGAKKTENDSSASTRIFDILREAELGGSDGLSITVGEYRLRLEIYLAQDQLTMVLRRHPPRIITWDELMLPPHIFTQATARGYGLSIFTGPPGSGKSTMMNAIIDRINHTQFGHILMLDDPTEIIHEPDKCYFSQRELGPGRDCIHLQRGLESSLRSAITHIVTGEVRHREAMRHLLESSNAGVFAFATLHNNTVVESISRVLNFFPVSDQSEISFLLSVAINVIVAQRRLITPEGHFAKDPDGRPLFGVEILVPNLRVREAIRANNIKDLEQQMNTGKKAGHMTINDHLAYLVKSRRLSFEVARFNSPDPMNFKLE